MTKEGYEPGAGSYYFGDSELQDSTVPLGLIILDKTPPPARLLKFILLEPDGATPTAGAKAMLYGSYDVGPSGFGQFLSAMADAHGRVEIPYAKISGYDWVGITFVAPDGTAGNLSVIANHKLQGEFEGTGAQDTIRLQPLGIVTGTARDPQGNPVAGLLVNLSRAFLYPGVGSTTPLMHPSGKLTPARMTHSPSPPARITSAAIAGSKRRDPIMRCFRVPDSGSARSRTSRSLPSP